MQSTSMKTWIFVFIAVRIFVEGAEEYFVLPTAWYYIKSLGQTKYFLGIVLSGYSMSAIVSGPVIGRLADKFGHIKCIIVFTFVMKVAGNFIYCIPVSAYFPLAGRLLSGFADGGVGVLYGQLALYTKEEYRAKMFVFFDGLFALGAVFGSTVSSFATFNANIFGWKINAGNSPGIFLAVTWFIQLLVALRLPNQLGYEGTSYEKSLVISDGEQDISTKQCSNDPPQVGAFSTISFLFYLIFLSLFYSSVVTFYTPLIALQHFHLQFIHVKLIFLNGSIFTFVLFFSLYIATEYIEERRLLAFLMLMQISAIAIFGYFALRWQSVSGIESYLLIVYVCLGMSFFSFSLVCSLLSKITHPRDAAYYQGSSFAALHVGIIMCRLISGFIFTKTLLLLYNLGLILSWVIAALWFAYEYQNLRDLKSKT